MASKKANQIVQQKLSIDVAKIDFIAATKLFNSMGLDLSTVINMFLKQCIVDQALPFKLHKFSDLEQSIYEAETGQLRTYSVAEWKAYVEKLFQKYSLENGEDSEHFKDGD